MDDTISAYFHHADLPELNSQEQAFVAAILAKSPVNKASEAAGITPATGYQWRKKPHIDEFIRVVEADRAAMLREQCSYTLEDAHLDIEMGKRMSANATEWYRGVELHMKLHGLGQKKEVEINVNNVHKVDQLQQLDDAQLLQLTGHAADAIYPDVLDAEVIEIE